MSGYLPTVTVAGLAEINTNLVNIQRSLSALLAAIEAASILTPPGGTSGQVQVNAAGVFGGLTDPALAALVKPSLLLTGTSGSIGGGALGAGAVATGTVTVTGATTAMSVVATPVAYPGNGFVWSGYVSSANTVTVVVTAVVAGTPSATAYNVRVIV